MLFCFMEFRSFFKPLRLSDFSTDKFLCKKQSLRIIIYIFDMLNIFTSNKIMNMINPEETVFYSIAKAIKEYKRFVQKKIENLVRDLTLDQYLVLFALNKNPTMSQKEIANLVFKDYASITRIIELMVNKNYLVRTINKNDRRKFHLIITPKGKDSIEKLTPLIKKNRKMALSGFGVDEVSKLNDMLNRIVTNCK